MLVTDDEDEISRCEVSDSVDKILRMSQISLLPDFCRKTNSYPARFFHNSVLENNLR